MLGNKEFTKMLLRVPNHVYLTFELFDDIPFAAAAASLEHASD